MKKKLNLDNLTITSFVTSPEESNPSTIRGAGAVLTSECFNTPVYDCRVPTYHPCQSLPVRECIAYTQEGCTPMV
jgi:hypothetical protein